MTDKRYCPKTGQFEDHDAQTCCTEPILHLKPVDDIMDAYRRMARMQAAHLLTADDWSTATELVEMAYILVATANFNEDPIRKARQERFLGRVHAYYEKHT